MSPVRALVALSFFGSLLAAQTTILVPADVPTIQGAIELAQDGDTVLVAAGTYPEELVYLGKAITVRSAAGAATTILSHYNTMVTFANGEGPGSVLRGFTVTGNVSSGPAIRCERASPLIQRCVIRGNRAVGGPTAAVFGDATLEDCIIEDNSNPDGTAGVWGAGTLRRCILRRNWGYDAAALYLLGGRVEDCSITENSSAEGSSGGAVSIWSTSTVVLERCLISANWKSTWSGMYSARGAGVTVGSPALLVNCTIADNHVTTPGFYGPDYGGLYGPATLVNCIVRGNDGFQLDALTATATYSDIEGGLAGTGNFDADALFRDAPHGDYRLLPGSPCIDTADPAAPLDPDGSRADVGAAPFAHAGTSLLLGSGVNPILLTNATQPAIGTTWLTVIQAGLVPGTTASAIHMRTAKLASPLPTPFGEILVGGSRLAAFVVPSNGVQDLFSFAIPSNLALLGYRFHAQGWVSAGAGGARLGNGLTVLIGE